MADTEFEKYVKGMERIGTKIAEARDCARQEDHLLLSSLLDIVLNSTKYHDLVELHKILSQYSINQTIVNLATADAEDGGNRASQLKKQLEENALEFSSWEKDNQVALQVPYLLEGSLIMQ